jgi:hypothetical protein
MSKVIVGLAVGLLLSVVLSAGMVAASPSVVGNGWIWNKGGTLSHTLLILDYV